MEAAGIDSNGEAFAELDELVMTESFRGQEIGKMLFCVGFRG